MPRIVGDWLRQAGRDQGHGRPENGKPPIGPGATLVARGHTAARTARPGEASPVGAVRGYRSAQNLPIQALKKSLAA
jgi:hypothetical protein